MEYSPPTVWLGENGEQIRRRSNGRHLADAAPARQIQVCINHRDKSDCQSTTFKSKRNGLSRSQRSPGILW
jgi:hypothetical protein